MMFPRNPAQLICFGLCGFWLLVVSTAGQGATVDAVVTDITEKVSTFLKQKNEEKITVGSIDGPRTGGGRSLQKELIDQLKKKGFFVVSEFESNLKLRGSLQQAKNSNRPVLTLDFQIVDSRTNGELVQFRTLELTEDQESVSKPDGQTPINVGPLNPGNAPDRLSNPAPDGREASEKAPPKDLPSESPKPTENASPKDFPQQSAPAITVGVPPIDDPDEIVPLVGGSSDPSNVIKETLKKEQGNPQIIQVGMANRDREILKSLNEPGFYNVNQFQAAPNSSANFCLEVRVSSSPNGPYTPVAIDNVSGYAFAGLKDGDFYEVKIINNEDYDVGVKLLIDGINTLDFAESETFRSTGLWIISRKSNGVVRGFFVNPQQVDTFLVSGKPANGVITSTLPRPSQIGTITAVFHPAWVQGEPRPPIADVLGVTANKTTPGPRIDRPSEIIRRTFCQKAVAFMTIRYQNPDSTLASSN